MPRGEKSANTGKQKREAEHIEEGDEDEGVLKKQSERRAWDDQLRAKKPQRAGSAMNISLERDRCSRQASARPG